LRDTRTVLLARSTSLRRSSASSPHRREEKGGDPRPQRGSAETHRHRVIRQAEAITREICGHTELDHERRKADALAHHRASEPAADELLARFQQYQHDAAVRGADLVSFRRLTEVLGKHRYDPPGMRTLVGNLAVPDLPLCRITPANG
jgi:hypothetical protein